MMDPSNINNFEDQWRKAFQEASETPPPSVWESIEARLDNEQAKVVPMWWQSRRIWYAAASLAALMVVGGGLWYSNTGTNGDVNVAVTTKAAHEPERKDTETVTAEPDAIESQRNEALAATEQPKSPSPAAGNAVVTNDNGVATKDLGAEIAAAPRTAGKSEPNASAKVRPDAGFRDIEAIAAAEQPAAKVEPAATVESAGAVNAASEAINTDPQSAQIAAAKVAGNGQAISADENLPVSAQLLASLPYSDLDVYVQKRHVFFRAEIIIEDPVKAKKPKEYYAGIGVMPASFNPDVQLKEVPMAFSAQSVSQRRSVSGSSEARASYAVQTQGGVRLSKHWSVETGLSYLRGNSAYEGGGYMLSAYNNAAANVLENALAATSPALADKSSSFNNGALYIDVAKKVSNNYQYLQLPVQAGFTLNPDKKFSYSLLGGMMANFFLTNELESASGEIIRTTASDEIYRGTSWAATTGLRLNYKLSSKWGANLTGSYQKAVSSGFRSNQTLDSHPYLYGVSWSVRYSF
ncbi:outer membrane beta-barrel protein [Dyadobacter fermentans]|uniref:outer membrane beta-barrel protein n=1 Tax=Dyadobacter fermentans TaxID=94254 RepID=UPI001E4FEF73|nr:outer membrane beta-barrel protein [Dyadobacter fermentans]